MLNFGFDDLRIVNPRDGWPNEKALDMSAGAKRVVESAQVFENLAAAIADLKFLYATTARQRDMQKNVVAPREMNKRDGLGIVFGGERSGLDNEDISLCDEILSIPVSAEYGSLNLAQSVAVVCYELSAGELEKGESDLASKDELLGMIDHLENELEQRGFFQEETKQKGMMVNIRNAFARAQFSPQEVRTMRGMIRSLAERSPK